MYGTVNSIFVEIQPISTNILHDPRSFIVSVDQNDIFDDTYCIDPGNLLNN